MSVTVMPDHGVMEGKGAYNRHARMQAGGIALSIPFLEEVAARLELDDGEDAVVIADYGSSQGKNSLVPVGVAVRTLRSRLGPDRPVFVFHIDQPSNDFNSLFQVLDADPETYMTDDPNIFAGAIGRSFYESVLPANSVHLGWSSYAALWLSHIPAKIPDHFVGIHSTDPERAAFDGQAISDWRNFLSLRAAELRPGGRLMVVLPGLDDDGVSGFESLMDQANGVFAEMVNAGELGADERERMVLGAYPRRTSDLLAPFQHDTNFHKLTVEHCELVPLPDPAWADYQRDGNEKTLAARHALFFRATFITSLTLALNEAQSTERCEIFANDFENRFKQRLANEPAPLDSFVQIFVVSKSAATPERE